MTLTNTQINPFWYCSHYIEDYTSAINRKYFSIQNLLILFLILSFIFFVTKKYKKANKEKKLMMKKWFAVSILFLEVLKLCVTGFLYPQYIKYYLPLHLCSFAGGFIVLEAIFKNNKIINQWWIYIFLFAGILGVVSPDSSYPWFNYYLFHAFVFHTLITTYAIIKIASHESVPTYKGIWLSTLFIAVTLIPIYFINKAFGTNYYLINDPQGFPVTNMIYSFSAPFGQWAYLFAMCLLGFILFHIIYFVYKTFKKRST